MLCQSLQKKASGDRNPKLTKRCETGNCQKKTLPTANCQLPTANCQLPTANSESQNEEKNTKRCAATPSGHPGYLLPLLLQGATNTPYMQPSHQFTWTCLVPLKEKWSKLTPPKHQLVGILRSSQVPSITILMMPSPVKGFLDSLSLPLLRILRPHLLVVSTADLWRGLPKVS